MSIIKNLTARSTYIHIPKWIDNELGLNKGEEIWIRLEGKSIIIQREKPAQNSEHGKGKHEST
jgi:antitoxin component of MazEF toxin-antitoxin module